MASEGANQDALREAFVEMLFALAISQVAIHVADVVRIDANFASKLPALAHLTVALVLISASWVGWRQSVSPGIKEARVKYIFSLPFVGLLLDVFLVIVYFVVVRSVEIDEKDGARFLTAPSAVPEAQWIVVVFGIYVAWDLVTDVLSPGCIPEHLRRLEWLSKLGRAALTSVYCSVVCLAMATIALMLAQGHRRSAEVLLVDGMLLTTILFFRTIKTTETFWASAMDVQDCKAFSKRRDTAGNENLWSLVLGFLYALCLVLLLYCGSQPT